MKYLSFYCKLPFVLQLEIFLYPLILIFRMPIAWAQSLWSARVLLNGRLDRYMGFHPRNAITGAFYRIQWININRYGRGGVSPVIGLGQFSLSSWFHLTLLASYIYANAGAATTLFGSLVWVLSHLIWADTAAGWWVTAVTAVLFFSTTTYAMAFARQNYQILGWMWFPVALYGIAHEYWVLGSFAWLGAAIAGVTPIFFAIPIVAGMVFTEESWVPIITLIPAIILVVTRFLPLVTSGTKNESVLQIAKLIGMTSRNVRYHREMHQFQLSTLYFLSLYLVSALLLWLATSTLPVLPMIGVFLFFANQRLFRVADEQSVILLVVSVFAFQVLQSHPSWTLLAVLWLAASPFAAFLSIQRLRSKISCNKIGGIMVHPPFDQTNIERDLEAFLRNVDPGQRVYFAYADPAGKYFNIFDGYRVIHELPLYVAVKKGVHLFPDWYAVGETNYEGAPECWGRLPKEVKENIERWKAHYAIVYQETGSTLDPAFQAEFEQIAEFDWAKHESSFGGVSMWREGLPTPKWFLVRPLNQPKSFQLCLNGG